MGYTHYWTQKRDFTEEEMSTIGVAVHKIVLAATDGRLVPNNHSDRPDAPLVIVNGMGDANTEAEIGPEAIRFNGLGPDLDHETFVFAAKREKPYDGAPDDQLGWAFCKTARKPYDLAVTATLAYMAAKWDFDVSSDGDSGDWEAGVALAQEVFGEPIPNPLIVEELVGG